MNLFGKTLYIQKEYRPNDQVINFYIVKRSQDPILTISLTNKNVFKSFLNAQDLHTYIYRYGDHNVLDSYGGCIKVDNYIKDTYAIGIYKSKRDLIPIVRWNKLNRYQVKLFFYMVIMMLVTQDTTVLESFKKAE